MNTPVFMGCGSGREVSDGGSCGTFEAYKGAMDEVGVWDRVLSHDEVVAMFRGKLVDEDRMGDACDACPNSTDTTCVPTTCVDEDGDGYGVPGAPACSAGQPSKFDCDDHDPAVHPGAVEACDQVDNNCNGHVDDACIGAPKVTKYGYNKFNQLLVSGAPVTCGAGDADCDGIADSKDNCPGVYNPGQEDSDHADLASSGPLGLWWFEDAAGSTTVKDTMGKYNGTMQATATFAASEYKQLNRSLSLDGAKGYVTVPAGLSTRISNQVTVETWLYATPFVPGIGG